MFCGKCGNPLAENAAFCGKCGEPVKQIEEMATEQAVQTEETVAQMPDEQFAQETPVETVPQADVAEAPAQEVVLADEPAPKAKKPFNKLWLKIGIPAVALIAVAALVLTNLGVIKGTAVKWFGSDREYLAYVETNAVNDLSEAVSMMYASTLGVAPNGENGGAGVAVGGEIKLKFGQLVNTLTSMSGGTDISWLKDIALAFETSNSGNALGGSCVLKLGGQSILTLEFVGDAAADTMYLRIPELSDTYIAVPMQLPMNFYEGMVILNEEMEQQVEDVLTTYGDKLPSQETISSLVEKYLLLALENLGEVTATEQSVTVEGVSENLTVLEVTISEKNVLDVLTLLLEEVKKDDTVKQIVEDVQPMLSELMPNADVDIYASFTQTVDESLADLRETASQAQTAPALIWRDFVNGKHEIVGREIVAEDARLLYYAMVQSGSDVALEMNLSDMLVLKGDGTKKGDVLNAETSLTMEGTELATLALEEFNTKTNVGTIRVELSDAALEEMDADSLAMFNLALEIVYKGEKAFEINLKSGSQLVLGLDVSAHQKDGVAITVPDSSKVLDAEDTTALQNWLSSLNLQKLIDSLKAAGVPADLLKGLEGLGAGDFEDMLEGYGLGYAEDDEYDYEYDEDLYDDDYTVDFGDLMV